MIQRKGSSYILRSVVAMGAAAALSAMLDSNVAHADIIPQNASVQGRFIRVSNNGAPTRILHIGEIEAFAPGITPAAGIDNANDLAIFSAGASFESESFTNGGTGATHGSVDAPFNGVVDGGADTYSRENAAFYMLDLGQTRSLGKLRVWQRGDGCCQDRLQNFSVDVLADNAGTPGPVTSHGSYTGQPPTSSFATFDFNGRLIRPGGAGGVGTEVVTGSSLASVRIRKTVADAEAENVLHVGELEAYESGTNANVGLSSAGSAFHTNQGSVFHGADAAMNNGIIDGGGDTWTRQGVPVEGQLDFNQTRQITNLKVYQRGDGCCGQRLQNFEVEGYDQEGNSVSLQTFPGRVDFAAPASFNLPDNFLMSSSDTLQIELNATGSTADRLQVGAGGSGLLRLSAGSTLDVANLVGTPTPGQVFDILDAGSIQGSFSTINLPAGNWDLSQLYTSGQITYVPEPGTLTLAAAAAGLLLRRRRA